MRRSEINAVLGHFAEVLARHRVHLPPFADWSPDRFRDPDARTIVERRLGWDVTDYDRGDFDRLGLALFTLRNGVLADLTAGRGMVYAEKLLLSGQDQVSPMHTHVLKSEDIINRGGAMLAVELYGSDDAGGFAGDRGGQVACDGIMRSFAPGEVLTFAPGESVTLHPGIWHAFWGDGGEVLIGEVSTVNDDETDNVFRDPLPRFSTVDEDVAPDRLLVSDYDAWLGAR